MDDSLAIDILAALAQPTRLDAFRRVVAMEPDGIPVGELARQVGVPQNTMSGHLAILARAGLVRGDRQSRSIIYRADIARLRDVTQYLLQNCCGGHPEACAPMFPAATACCSSTPSKAKAR